MTEDLEFASASRSTMAPMEAKLAVLAENQPYQAPPAVGPTPKRLNKLQIAAAECYAAGFLRVKTAEILMHHFWPEDQWSAKILKMLRASIKKMESNQSWRDYLYQLSVAKLDLASPHIIEGITGKATRGDVPAARFAFELTGRHSKEEKQVTAIQVVLGDVPRPGAIAAPAGTTVLDDE